MQWNISWPILQQIYLKVYKIMHILFSVELSWSNNRRIQNFNGIISCNLFLCLILLFLNDIRVYVVHFMTCLFDMCRWIEYDAMPRSPGSDKLLLCFWPFAVVSWYRFYWHLLNITKKCHRKSFHKRDEKPLLRHFM